jgi:hypothetical protein
VLNVLYWFCVDSNFEILDLANDDPLTYSATTNRSETNCWFVIVCSIFLEFFKTNFIEEQLIVNLVLVLVCFYYFFANEKDPAIILPFGSKAFLFFGG